MTNKLFRGVFVKVYVYEVSPTGERTLVKVVER